MRPKDLKAPFDFKEKERIPLIQEGVFYIPSYAQDGQTFVFPSLKTLFKNSYPIYIECCSGNGEWAIEKAQTYPQINWITIEMRFNRVRKIYSKRFNLQIKNLFIVCGRAEIFIKKYLLSNCIDAFYVNFPDPWPKRKHEKYRLIQKPFIQELSRVMKPRKIFHLVSDAFQYIKQIEKEMGEIQNFKKWDIEKPFGNHYGNSYFERLWLSKKRKIYSLTYLNDKNL